MGPLSFYSNDTKLYDLNVKKPNPLNKGSASFSLIGSKRRTYKVKELSQQSRLPCLSH